VSALRSQLRRLTWQVGLSPTNCRKVMTACIQSVAMFDAELCWKGEATIGNHRQGQLHTAVGQPGSPCGYGLLPENQPSSTGNGIGRV